MVALYQCSIAYVLHLGHYAYVTYVNKLVKAQQQTEDKEDASLSTNKYNDVKVVTDLHLVFIHLFFPFFFTFFIVHRP